MADDEIPAGLNFTQACKYLELSPDEFTELRRQELIACVNSNGRQVYPQAVLDLTRKLLALGQTRRWGHATLAWCADLVFATEVGRAILLPIISKETLSDTTSNSWLETPYVSVVLRDLDMMLDDNEGPLVALLRSLVAIAVSENLFWPDHESIKNSALYPIIEHFEAADVPVLGQGAAVARDAVSIFIAMIYTFTTISSPISLELKQLVGAAHAKFRGTLMARPVSTEEQAIIAKEPLIPVDKVYSSKANEIHTPPTAWDFRLGVLIAEKRTVSLQMKLPLDADQDFIDNIIDFIRPFVGTYGARVVHLLYEIANDPPFWRNPLITVDSNELLDRLGLKRDSRGVHYSRNRERLRDVLNIAHSLEIVGEYTTWENGQPARKAFYKTVLSLIGATFDPEESRGIPTSELRTRGLPKTMQIRLNFYDGVRRPDGKLGNQFVLMPRLAEPARLPSANYASTSELLKSYLLFRYRQTRMQSRILTLTRQTALEKANITNKHAPRATATLRKALDRLVENGTLKSYSPHLPTKQHETFEVELSEAVVHNLSSEA